jgi:hypothetical protein
MSERPPSQFFHTPLEEERRERSWRAIAARLPARQRRRTRVNRVLALVAVLSIAIALVATTSLRRPAGAIDGAVLETGAGERQSLELGDGSQVLLEPSTKLRLERVSGRGIRLKVEAGAVYADVTHKPGRPFTVVAGPVEVHVVGTKFRVELDPTDEDIVVSVSEGRVSLTRSDGQPIPNTLGAGETWSSEVIRLSAAARSTVADTSASARIEPRGTRAAARPSVPSKKFRELWREGQFVAAWAEIPPSDFDAILVTAGPQDLFAIGESARMSGHPHSAARAFDALRRRFRSDARAPLAALELGRLRLNELDSPLEAKEAFEDAVRLDPKGTFREDAEARTVEALEAAGLTTECVEARDRYLATYPGGLHERIVKRRCK